MMPAGRTLPLLAACLLAASSSARALDLFVDQANGSDGNDGLSWATARATVGSALETAATSPGPDTISVAAGRYLEGHTLVVPAETALLGGFPPAGAGPRDPAANATILDADGAFAPVVSFPPGSDGTVLDGFVIRGGASADPGDAAIGGISIEEAAPLVRGNVVEGNRGCHAGLSLYRTEIGPGPRIEGNVFRNNSGLFTPLVCTLNAGVIVVNTAPGVDLGTFLSGNRIVSNSSGFTDPGLAAVWFLGGGRGRIEDTIIEANEEIGMVLAGTVALSNVLVAGNESSGIQFRCPGDYVAENLTVAANGGEGIAVVGGPAASSLQVVHSILWGNTEQIVMDCATASVSVETSVVEGGFPGGTGILADDPLFVPGPLGDYYLSQTAAGQPVTSPAVDAGTVQASAVGLDVRTTRTDSLGDTGTLDLGFHYEGIPSLTVLRGTRADALAPHRTVASLPFVDDPGTLWDPGLPLLFYRVPEAVNELFVTKDLPAGAPRLVFR